MIHKIAISNRGKAAHRSFWYSSNIVTIGFIEISIVVNPTYPVQYIREVIEIK